MKNEVIVLKQAPVIEYELLDAISEEVKAKIESLNLDSIEASESTLSTVKNIRSELSREFKDLEEKRKLVKETVMKPYNDFDEQYKAKISNLFNDADKKLKSKIDEVEDEILSRKIEGLKDYFLSVNKHDFITFEDVFKDEKIIKSKTDKYYEGVINDYLAKVEADLHTIGTVSYEERVLAKYQMVKDLNRAISEVNLEVQREDAIRARQKEQEAAKAEVKPEPIVQPKPTEPKSEPEQTFKCSFTVYGTKNQLRELKEFMNAKGLKYERGN
ncbi:MAG: DUF1351 domain-containing protein [Campylobacteraceae bacterium]|nr:DUF1351 domain-containing protein [Campylobacteraceae bacterium]